MLQKQSIVLAAIVAMGAITACRGDATAPTLHPLPPASPSGTVSLLAEPPCTAVCYADAVNGNDLNGGGAATEAKQTIQAALNQVNAGGTVRVLPGTYNEVAPNSLPTSVGGGVTPYQFGLFFASSKPGITLMGVTAGDVPVVNPAATLATINTNATNNFGTSGIFVEANNTTIRGVKIGPNAAGDNKTIEVVADNFTLQFSATAIPTGGAVYISEFDAPAGAVSSYHITQNLFADATQIAISSGAGKTGPVSGREITGNTFVLGNNGWPAISFNGAGGVPWYTKPVGGAVILANTFSGGGAQYIRARGDYIEAEFAWQTYWTSNTFDKATVALANEGTFAVRSYSYTSAPYTFTSVRRIGATMNAEVSLDIAEPGDVVLAKNGSYAENVIIPQAITLRGASTAGTIVQGAGTGAGITLAGGLSNVTLNRLTAQGFDYGIQMPTGPLSTIQVSDVAAINNDIHGIWVQAFGINNVAFIRVNASNNNSVGGLAGRGLWMINGIKRDIRVIDGTYSNNGLVGIDVSDGNATGVIITGNTVTGNGDSGIGVFGAQGPSFNVVANNTVTNNGRFGIEIKNATGNELLGGPGSVVVRNNTVSRTAAATDARDYAGIAVFHRVTLPQVAPQPFGVVVTENAVSGFVRKALGSTGDGFGILVEGANHVVTKNLVSGNDVGIQIQSGNAADVQSTPYFDRGDAAPSSALINRNSITSNTLLDIRNVGAGLTDATCNWYGSATGPAAGKLSGSLTTTPWLVSSNLTGACALDAQGPITTLTPPAPAQLNTPISVPVSISDLTTGGSPVVSYTWSRDGGAAATVPFLTPTITQSFNLTVPADAAADVDNICVKGTDVYGNVGPEVCVLVVWYDPSAGFVTGGGQIQSPAGAYASSPALTGKANFGFVSKYQKGNSVPTGNTEFQFNAANLNFKATLMDWLVVSGSRAQFKGAGTLNGVAGYTFMLTAIDGKVAGNGSPDKFRIRILNSAGVMIYDNQMNAPDSSDPTTVVTNGSIIIHK